MIAIFSKIRMFVFVADIDDCLSVNCSGSGNCSDRVNGYFCYCYDGYYGINCEIGNALFNNFSSACALSLLQEWRGNEMRMASDE